jgi:hypothetical protein
MNVIHVLRMAVISLNKKRMILVAALSIIGILSLVVLIPEMDINSVPTANSITNTGGINSAYPVGKEEERSIVPPEQIVSGGPPPDGIPSSDNPKFIQI